jgi:hypothetical protein
MFDRLSWNFGEDGLIVAHAGCIPENRSLKQRIGPLRVGGLVPFPASDLIGGHNFATDGGR